MPVADVVVVGLGAMGSAAVYQLARRGVDVIGLDRLSPPHEFGSSHGETRITRQAIGEGDQYVPFVLRSHEIWRELEAETGEQLLLTCGTLIVNPIENVALHHGKEAFLERTVTAAKRFGIAHETLSGTEIRRRFPQFAVPDSQRGYYEPGGGLVFPERCITSQIALARRHGARLQLDETVRTIEPHGSGVRVTTDRDHYEAARVVVAAGAWTPGLAGGALDAMRIHRQALFWFEPTDTTSYAAASCPVFIWIHGSGESDLFYGIPTPPGGQGVKIGTESYVTALAKPELLDRNVPAAEADALYRDHIAGRLPGITPRCFKSAACLYTMAPDGDFVIDQRSDSDRITLVSACSGHGFKHSAAIGERVAAMVAAGRAQLDVREFSKARLAQFPTARHTP